LVVKTIIECSPLPPLSLCNPDGSSKTFLAVSLKRIGAGPDKRGGLNKSMQHLLKVFILRRYEAEFVRWHQFKQNNALFRS
jgi:hypothetical protein